MCSSQWANRRAAAHPVGDTLSRADWILFFDLLNVLEIWPYFYRPAEDFLLTQWHELIIQ